MKTIRSTACMFMLIFLLVPLGVLANELPFLPIDDSPVTIEFAQKRYQEMKALPITNKRRIEFFKRSLENTGYSETELDIIMKRGAIKIEECGTCVERTYAMYPDGSSAPWRYITPTEPRALIIVNEDRLISWFLPKCSNPNEKPELPPPPKTVTITERVKSNCCWDSAPPIATRGALIPGAVYGNQNFWGGGVTIGTSSPQFGSIFYPTTCSGEMFQNKGEERK